MTSEMGGCWAGSIFDTVPYGVVVKGSAFKRASGGRAGTRPKRRFLIGHVNVSDG